MNNLVNRDCNLKQSQHANNAVMELWRLLSYSSNNNNKTTGDLLSHTCQMWPLITHVICGSSSEWGGNLCNGKQKSGSRIQTVSIQCPRMLWRMINTKIISFQKTLLDIYVLLFLNSSILFSHMSFIDDDVLSQNQQTQHPFCVISYVGESILWVSE